jgi:hypothetical protein
MVLTTVKTGAPDAVALLYDPPSGPRTAGEVRMIDGSRSIVLVSGFKTADQLVAPLSEIREGIRKKMKERRYLQAFRHSNLEFLQRYSSVRQKIQAALTRPKK